MNIKTSIATVWSDWSKIEAQYGQKSVPSTALLEFLQKNFENVEGKQQCLPKYEVLRIFS